MAGKVFINYRRAESLKDARHLASLLDKGALKGRIFIDKKGLDGAPDWLMELERQVTSSDVMVALICKDWTEIRDAGGKRRIDDENDFVRFELAEAFRRKVPIVPVLVDGASMPRGDQLPPNLLLLTRPQAELLRSESFDADVLKIGRRLQTEIAERRKVQRTSVPIWVVGATALAALSVGLLTGPMAMERLGLSTPMAQRIEGLERNLADHTRKLDEARDDRVKSEAKLIAAQFQGKQFITEKEAALRDARRLTDELAAAKSDAASAASQLVAVQSQVKQLTTEKEAALREAKRLTDELAAVKSEAASRKASYDNVRKQLDGAIKKHYGPCLSLSQYRFIHPDGSSECRSSGWIKGLELRPEAPLLVPEPQPQLRQPQFKLLAPPQ